MYCLVDTYRLVHITLPRVSPTTSGTARVYLPQPSHMLPVGSFIHRLPRRFPLPLLIRCSEYLPR